MSIKKQRQIRPGRDYNYTQGVVAKASTAISENDVCYISSYDGHMVCTPADAGALGTSRGKLWIAKHEIPSGERGVLLPWRTITTDTSSLSALDEVFLGNSTAGSWVAAPDASTVNVRVVGQCITSNATTGKLLLDPNMVSDQNAGGVGVDVAVTPQLIQGTVAASGGTDSYTVAFDCKVVDAWIIVTTGDATTENATLAEGANTMVTIATGSSSSADDLVRASAIDQTYSTLSKGDTLNFDLSSTNVAVEFFVLLQPL